MLMADHVGAGERMFVRAANPTATGIRPVMALVTVDLAAALGQLVLGFLGYVRAGAGVDLGATADVLVLGVVFVTMSHLYGLL